LSIHVGALIAMGIFAISVEILAISDGT